MWNYEKRLQFPINIKEPNAKLAQVIISQYGGPDGEMGASMRYLSQRYSMPYKEVAGLLTDIGTEESVHRCCMWIFQNKKRRTFVPVLRPSIYHVTYYYVNYRMPPAGCHIPPYYRL